MNIQKVFLESSKEKQLEVIKQIKIQIIKRQLELNKQKQSLTSIFKGKA